MCRARHIIAIILCLIFCCSDVELIGDGALLPDSTIFYTVTCNVNIPSPEGEVEILFDGPGNGLVTTTNNGDIYSSGISFITPTAADSGTYTCRAEVGEVTVISATFAIDFVCKSVR